MRNRIITTLGGAIVLGIWVYGHEKDAAVLGGDVAALCALAFALAIGAFVGRWWVLFALLGPLAALGYLEASGFVGSGGDWARDPLFSPSAIATFVGFGTCLALGTQLDKVSEWIREAWR